MIFDLLPFWLFILLFKFGSGLHYTLLSSLGARIMPIWLVGLLIGGGSIMQLLLDVPAGYLLDRLGYVRVLRVTTFLFVLAAGSLLFGLTPLTFVITLFLSTCGWLFFSPGGNAYMLVKAPRQEAGKYLGFYHAVLSLGIVLAAMLLVYVINATPRTIGMVVGVILLGSFSAVMLTPRERESVHTERKTIRHSYYIRRNFIHHIIAAVGKLNPASTILILQNFASALFYASIWFSVPLILASGTGDNVLGIGMAMFDLAIVVLGTFLGKLSDRWNSRALIFFGLLIFATAGTLLGFNLNIWFLVLGFLATAGDEMSSVSLWAWLDRKDKDHKEDGLINGAIILFEDLGWAIGPMLSGLLYSTIGPKWAITIAALPIFLVWIISIVLTNKFPLGKEPQLQERQPHKLRHKR